MPEGHTLDRLALTLNAAFSMRPVRGGSGRVGGFTADHFNRVGVLITSGGDQPASTPVDTLTP